MGSLTFSQVGLKRVEGGLKHLEAGRRTFFPGKPRHGFGGFSLGVSRRRVVAIGGDGSGYQVLNWCSVCCPQSTEHRKGEEGVSN